MRRWCRAYFRNSIKCDSVDNNSTKAFNFVLISAREKPTITMMEGIKEHCMERTAARRALVKNWKHNCGPNIGLIISENCAASFN